MTTIFSTIMLAALSSGARLFFGTFVVFVALMCIWVVWALISSIRETDKLSKKSIDLSLGPTASDWLHLSNVLGGLANGSSHHHSSGSNS